MITLRRVSSFEWQTEKWPSTMPFKPIGIMRIKLLLPLLFQEQISVQYRPIYPIFPWRNLPKNHFRERIVVLYSGHAPHPTMAVWSKNKASLHWCEKISCLLVLNFQCIRQAKGLMEKIGELCMNGIQLEHGVGWSQIQIFFLGGTLWHFLSFEV